MLSCHFIGQLYTIRCFLSDIFGVVKKCLLILYYNVLQPSAVAQLVERLTGDRRTHHQWSQGTQPVESLC